MLSHSHLSSSFFDQSWSDAKTLKRKVAAQNVICVEYSTMRKTYGLHIACKYVKQIITYRCAILPDIILIIKGVPVLIGESGTAICRAKVLCATVDLPAKAKLVNFTQFNGKYECTVCTQEGTVVKVGRGSTRVYPYLQPCAPIRTRDESYEFAKSALSIEEVSYISSTLTIPLDGCRLHYVITDNLWSEGFIFSSHLALLQHHQQCSD